MCTLLIIYIWLEISQNTQQNASTTLGKCRHCQHSCQVVVALSPARHRSQASSWNGHRQKWFCHFFLRARQISSDCLIFLDQWVPFQLTAAWVMHYWANYIGVAVKQILIAQILDKSRFPYEDKVHSLYNLANRISFEPCVWNNQLPNCFKGFRANAFVGWSRWCHVHSIDNWRLVGIFLEYPQNAWMTLLPDCVRVSALPTRLPRSCCLITQKAQVPD